MQISLRSLRLLWLAGLAFFVAIALFPVSDLYTRSAGLALVFILWAGLVGLCWRQCVVRNALLAATVASAVFISLPGRRQHDLDSARADYIAGLRRYEGVSYYWGGESCVGIDCSGLVRRGLVDSLFLRGLRSFDPASVREAFSLWWHDCTARDLGLGENHLTVHLLNTPSINALDYSKILPGDLAVTSGGNHIMAYLGSNTWIEAEPEAAKVITVKPPSRNGWFRIPMNIVRWHALQK